jgi:uncharacterized membrane protein YkvA (DUF1232 family)
MQRLQALSQQMIYAVLLLYYAYKRKETPPWAKKIILGSLAYFLSPIDSIPDLTPVIGFTDDLGVMSFGIVTIACYINEEVRTKARKKLSHFVTTPVEEDLDEIDNLL